MMYHDIRCHVDLLEIFRHLTKGKDISAPPKRKTYQRVGYGRGINVSYTTRQLSRIDQLQATLESLRYVDEVCFDHQAWAIVCPETDRFPVADRRLAEVKAKIQRAMERWAASLPEREAAP